MQPNDQQQAIIESDAKTKRVIACPGTGKTTTLRWLAESRPDDNILYLVFNKSAQEAARKVFPPNTTVKTFHGFAFQYEGYKWKNHLGNMSPADFLEFFNRRHILAGLAHNFMMFFLNSPEAKLEDAVEPFHEFLTPKQIELFDEFEEKIVEACRKVSTAWYNKQMKCPHDFYLKLFHRSGELVRQLNKYDLILVDESQDLNQLLMDALKLVVKPYVCVGDPKQSIYSFRYAVNAMEQLDLEHTFPLQHSHRFGVSVAKLLSVFGQEAFGEPDFVIHGNPNEISQVFTYKHLPILPRAAMISRTNLALFANILDCRDVYIPYVFERDLSGVFSLVLDVWNLYAGERCRIQDRLIKGFESFYDLKSYAEAMEEYQLLSVIKLVEQYRRQLPWVVFAILKDQKEHRQDRDAVILTTIHTSKGQEYPTVCVDYDYVGYVQQLEKKEKINLETLREVYRIGYVAQSRTIHKLYLPATIQKILTEKWEREILHLPMAQYDDAPDDDEYESPF